MGRPKSCNPCCDGAGGDGPECDECVGNVSPAQWTFTMSGLTNFSCISGAYCGALNRVWTLWPDPDSPPCGWIETFIGSAFCGLFGSSVSQRAQASLSIQPTRILLLLRGSTNDFPDTYNQTIATYEKAGTAPWDCLASHTLTLTASGVCASHPASITISPA